MHIIFYFIPFHIVSRPVGAEYGTGGIVRISFRLIADFLYDLLRIVAGLISFPCAKQSSMPLCICRQLFRIPLRGKEQETDSGRWMGTEEVDAILEKTLYANKKAGKATGKNRPGSHGEERKNGNYASGNTRTYGQGGKESGKKAEKKEKYLLVDGYNIIFAWEDLKELAKASIDGARGKLMDILCNYQGIRGCRLILVFDAYRVQGHDTELFDYHNIHVVYTKEAETADQYIEKFAYENGKKADITVATSDGLEQIIIRGQGCALLSARELKEEIQRASEEIRGTYMDQPPGSRNYLLDAVTKETREQLDQIR